MRFTFGVCVCENNINSHEKIIKSIEGLNIPEYEIIFIGAKECKKDSVRFIEFDESIRNGWITKKKNILCSAAIYENIVLLHDYLKFHDKWYEGFLKNGDDFDICMNVILNANGSRFRDWCLNPYKVIPPIGPLTTREFSLPYDENRLIPKMYISGAYWVAKTKFMKENPLDESLLWGESEDLEWSNRVLSIANYKMNSDSIVNLIKFKHYDFDEISNESLLKIL